MTYSNIPDRRLCKPEPDYGEICADAVIQCGADPEAPSEHPGYIYILQAGPHYKIGRTKDLGNRFKSVRLQLPFPVKLVMAFETPTCVALEKALHEIFRGRRENGEWFRLTDSELDVIWGIARTIRRSQ